MRKPITQLTVNDLQRHTVWAYSEDSLGNVVARPIKSIPVDCLEGRLIGCQVTLSNGQQQWASLSNISLANSTATEHFLTVSVLRASKWFHLARYFDVDYHQRGPLALAAFLDLQVAEVFPIRYDIGPFVVGARISTSGMIPKEPPNKLSMDELIALSLK